MHKLHMKNYFLSMLVLFSVVELLEYKLQQEQIIANDLQNSLRAEQDRSAELRQHLQTEQTTVSDLKSDLSEVTIELEAALQTRHELQQNLQKLRFVIFVTVCL